MEELIVKLNATEMRLGVYVGKLRHRDSLKKHFRDGRVSDNRTSEQINIDGALSEIAYCKAHNLYPDLDCERIYPQKFDAMTKDCATIDIKSCVYPKGHLVVKENNPEKCVYYVLMIGEEDTWRYAGYIKGDDLLTDENFGDHFNKNAPCWAVKQEKLDKRMLI